MSALAGSHDAMGPAEPCSGLGPLARIPSEAVEKDDGRPGASEIGTRKSSSFADVLMPPHRLHPFRLAHAAAVKVS
jgi:hypothetical protein